MPPPGSSGAPRRRRALMLSSCSLSILGDRLVTLCVLPLREVPSSVCSRRSQVWTSTFFLIWSLRRTATPRLSLLLGRWRDSLEQEPTEITVPGVTTVKSLAVSLPRYVAFLVDLGPLDCSCLPSCRSQLCLWTTSSTAFCKVQP